MNNNSGKIRNIIINIVTIAIIIVAVVVYRKFDFNFYIKGVVDDGITQFTRDSQIKYSQTRSYKIENTEENDAMFFKEISVIPNTPYKVTCMVKTENVKNSDNNPMAGAQICVNRTEDHSIVLSGDNDWTKVEFMFDSKSNDTVEIGFRLGGNLLRASGTAWFSDLTIEQGIPDKTNTWNFGCFVIENIDAQAGSKVVDVSLTYNQKQEVNENIAKFKNSIEDMSNGKIDVEYEVINITEPLTTLSYEEDNGYYISEKDIYPLINDYVQAKEFDHIFICTNLPLESELIGEDVSEWIGLGNMIYLGKGFSNIRVMDESYNYAGKDTFPEEVYIHEFLHTLERNAGENGYEIPELHDYDKYGYYEDRYYGLKQWYTDYMNKNIKDNGTLVGLPAEIFTMKPPTFKDFEFGTELDLLDEPSNIIETIQSIIEKIQSMFETTNTTYQAEGVA